MKTHRMVPRAAALLVLAVLGLACAAQAQKFETPPTFTASSLLPRQVLSGPSYRIDDTVTNDGYLNSYMIRSRFGDLPVTSTALLYIRLSEFEAMDKMDQVAAGSAFGSSLADKGKQTVQGAVNLVTDPLNTVSGALSGVGKLFARAQESLVESTPSKYEDNRFQNIIGYSQTKRDYAKQFGVDPYSTNPLLQAKLNQLAEAGYAGSITGTALQALIPGGVGVAVSSVSTSALLESVDLTVPPTDLRRANREALLDAGVSESLARLFIDNDQFTPSQQTFITKAVTSMANTEDKNAFFEFAAGTQDQDVAFFRQRMAQMYASYDRNVARLERFVRLGRFVAAQRQSGELVLCFPLDYLVCTRTNDSIMRALGDTAAGMSARGVELWLTGKASPMTRQLAKSLGWKLHEDGAVRLLGSRF